MSKLVLMAALVFTLPARANQSYFTEVISLVDKFKETMVKCPERIWSNYNWNELNIVFLYPSQSSSWIWDIDPNVIRKIDNRRLPSRSSGLLYDFFEIDGQSTQSLNMENGPSNDELFQLGVHEFFHIQEQGGWPGKYGSEQPYYQNRGTTYPIDARPRYYRRMLFDNLEGYFASNNEEYLKKAKYWFDRWAGEYPDEIILSTDTREGTAYYVETMAWALADLGCTATEEQLKNHVLAQVRNMFGDSVSGHILALDREGYDIGGLSSLILRFNNTDLPDWNQKMAEGDSPLEVLFAGVASVPGNHDEYLREGFIYTASAMNREYGLILDDDIENYSNKDYIRVSAPDYWIQPTFFPQFFAYSSKIGKDMYPYARNHHFLSPDEDGSNYIVKANAVVIPHGRNPCTEIYEFVLVSSDAININNRSAYVSNEVIEGRLVGELREDDEGYSYFCVE